MFRLNRATVAMTAGLVAFLAGINPALADVPAVLDRIPAGTPVVVAVRDMDAFSGRVIETAKSLKMEQAQLTMVTLLLNLPGLNKKGSMGLALTPPAEGGGEPTVVMIVPVSDYGAFVGGLGGKAEDAVTKLTFDKKPGFAKNLKDGYAAIGPDEAAVTAFEAKAGQKGSHEKMLGTVGMRIADHADGVVIANLAALKPQLDKALEGLKGGEGQIAAAPGGEMMQGYFKLVQSVMGQTARDGSAGVMGVSMGEKGMTVDLGLQFKEGTEGAKFFGGKGNSAPLMGKLPAVPFLFAGAYDLSTPTMKSMIRNMSEAMGAGKGGKDKEPEFGMMANAVRMLDKSDGVAFVMGASDMGSGLFSNMSTFTQSKDPAAYVAATKEMYAAMNGKTSNGATFTTEFKATDKEIAGIKVDSWSMKTEMDPNDPMAMQVQMMQSMLIGPEGKMGGYMGQVPGGVVSTMSANTPLMTKAIEAAKSGNGLSGDDLFKQTAAGLPADRSIEIYIGTKQLLDTIGGVLMMMGGGPELTAPEKLAPIGLAATTDGGGMGIRLVLPHDVIKTFAENIKKMQEGEDGPAAPEPKKDEKGKSPRF